MAASKLTDLTIKAMSLVMFIICFLLINTCMVEASTVLYYGQSYSPFEMRYTYSSQTKTLFTSVNGTIKPVALDASHGKLYFADPLEGIIYQSNLTGSATSVYLTGVYADGLAVDADRGYFYYTESHTDAGKNQHYDVIRASLANPADHTELYSTTTGTPEAITVAANGDLYFSDPHESVKAIYKVASGSTTPTVFISNVHAYGLGIDGQYLYYSEACDPDFQMRRASLANPGTFIDFYSSSTGAPKALTISGTDLYFADMHTTKARIYKIALADIGTAAPTSILSNVNAGGIAVLANTAPEVSVNNGISTIENATVGISSTALQTIDAENTPEELIYELVRAPGKGKLTKDGADIAAGASFTQFDINTAGIRYVPNADENGSDSFTFKVNDGLGEYTLETTFGITINMVNSAPTFIKGANQTILEDAGAQTITGWATGMSTGPADESSQTYGFSASNNNEGLFDVQPQLSPEGTLIYTPKANVYGIATVDVTISDDGGTANGGLDHSTQSFVITINGVNEVPSFTAGANQTVLEDAGARTIPGWASGISAGPMETDQTLQFIIISNDNSALFSVQPAVSATGTLTYTAAANANGSATVMLSLQDNGGTSYGGIDTSSSQQFTITVNAVNDAPTFTKGADQTITEGAGAQIVAGWATAISAGPADESQTYDFGCSNDNNSLFEVQPMVQQNGTLTYTPAASAYGRAAVTVTLSDYGGTANGGVDTSSQSFVIFVTSDNNPPILTVPEAQSILEDSALSFSGGKTISIADSDAGTNPVRLEISVDNGTLSLSGANGLVFTSGDGNADSLMQFTGTLANINQALNGMRYLPPVNFNGSAVITIYVNDQGNTGVGGELTDTKMINITIASVNDAPTLDAIADLTLPINPERQTVNLTGISAGGEEVQNISVTATSNKPNMITDISVNYSSPDATGTLAFTPSKSGTAVITVRVNDNGGNTNGGISTRTVTFTVSVAQSHSGGGGGGSYEPPVIKPLLNNQALIDLSNDADATACIAVTFIKSLASGNQALIIKNQGITVEFPPGSLQLPELDEALKYSNSVFEVKVARLSDAEKAKLMQNAPLGQSTGLFEIGGLVFDLSAQFKFTLADGTTKIVRVSAFPEPVTITIDLSALGELSPAQIAALTGVRFVKDSSGNISVVKLGGTYNPATKSFTFHTDQFSLYSVLQADKLVAVNLVLGSTTATVNGTSKTLDVGPALVNGRTMVPFRFIGEAFGAKVDWIANSRTVVIILNNKEMRLVVNEKVPGYDVSPVIIQGRTMVPIRYIAESLGANVKWYPNDKKIEIVK